MLDFDLRQVKSLDTPAEELRAVTGLKGTERAEELDVGVFLELVRVVNEAIGAIIKPSP